MSVHIRAFEPADRDGFLAMWQAFTATAPDEPGNPEVGQLNFQRVMDGGPLRGIVALDESKRLVGFALFLCFPFTWARGDACYLQDIFVTEEARGRGAAGVMIEHLVALGRAEGWFKIFWMTQPDNHSAQRVYERVAQRMDYLRYDLNISPA